MFLNPVEQYNLSVPENGPQNLGLLNIIARARSLNNAYAMMSFEIISGISGLAFLLLVPSSIILHRSSSNTGELKYFSQQSDIHFSKWYTNFYDNQILVVFQTYLLIVKPLMPKLLCF